MTQPVQMSMPAKFQDHYLKVQSELDSLQQTVRELTEKVASDDGMVTVTVGAKGEVIDLELSPRIYRTTDSKALAQTIKQTIWKASGEVSAKLFDLISPIVGGTIEGVDLKDQLDRLPAAAKETN